MVPLGALLHRAGRQAGSTSLVVLIALALSCNSVPRRHQPSGAYSLSGFHIGTGPRSGSLTMMPNCKDRSNSCHAGSSVGKSSRQKWKVNNA
jgi:hypothetical protein